MTWTADEVRARFVEAAETDRRMPRVKGFRAGSGGFWPAFVHTTEDMNGWGETRLKEHRAAFWSGEHRAPAADAISRMEEVLDWSLRLIIDEERRTLIWAWVFSKVTGRPFRVWCKKTGRNRATAYERIDNEFHRLSEILKRNNVFRRLPSGMDDGQSGHSGYPEDDIADRDASPRFERADDAHELTLPDDPEAFAKWLAQTNAARRKEQERRRRAKMKRIEEGLAA